MVTCIGKSAVPPRNLWGSIQFKEAHNQISCPYSADTALKPYIDAFLTLDWFMLQAW